MPDLDEHDVSKRISRLDDASKIRRIIETVSVARTSNSRDQQGAKPTRTAHTEYDNRRANYPDLRRGLPGSVNRWIT